MILREDMLFDNRYLLKKLLGCGGFSEVWLVEDTKVGHKKMALKVFVPDRGLDDDGVQLFSREFELVFDLNHTHLLRPAHFDVCERSPYLLMPFCEQGSANKLVGSFTEEDTWRFMHDVASGLAYLHEQNPPIIHQDIKPDNILRDTIGNYQITDFGISIKARNTLRKSVISAKSGGTMAYMPPERFGKDNTPIKASDIWAMGATVYELISGDLPFGEHGGLMQKSGAEIPNIPGVGKWSHELQEIISRCLQKDPWERPLAQKIVEWTDLHAKGQKIIFDNHKKQSSGNQKMIFLIAGGVLGLICTFVLVFFLVSAFRNNLSEKQKNKTTVVNNPTQTTVAEKDTMANITAELPTEDPDTQPPSDETPEATVTTTSQTTTTPPASTTTQSNPATATTTPPATTTTVPASTAWLAEYDRIMNTALSAYGNKEYEKAKTEYNKALRIANQNGDKQKATYVNGQIAECDKAIEAEEKRNVEARRKQIQDRLAAYNFVGNFPLGTNYLIVQRKSNNHWGIIDKNGVEREPFNYTQVSARLKNGYYALKNEQGWVVFDTSKNKVATNRDNLDDFR